MGIYAKALLLIILLFAAITFGTQNAEFVKLRYYFGLTSMPVPLYLVLYVAIILGMIAGMAIGITTRLNLKRKAKTLARANASLQEELDKIKTESGEEKPTGPEMALARPEATQTRIIASAGGGEAENQTGAGRASEDEEG
jgi:uncharacterized integral membrane protein